MKAPSAADQPPQIASIAANPTCAIIEVASVADTEGFARAPRVLNAPTAAPAFAPAIPQPV